MNEEQHLPFWKYVFTKEKVVIVPQTGSRSSHIHRQRGLYLYQMDYYTTLKERLQVLHELEPKYFQIELDK